MEKKRGILYWLRVILCLFALIAMGLRFAGIKVSADEITLTYEQSVALFGSHIQGMYYSKSLNQDIPCYAVLVGTSSDTVPADHWGGIYTYNNSFTGLTPNWNTAIPDFIDREYLIYAVCPYYMPPTAWPSWSSSDTSDHSNFSVQFPFDVTSTTSLRFSVLYTFANTISGGYSSYNRSSISLITSNGSLTNNLIRFTTNNRPYTLSCPLDFGTTLNASQIPESNRVVLSVLPCDISQTDPFSISGFNLNLNAVAAPKVVAGMGMPLGQDIGYCPYIYIECPTFSNYVPATTPAVTVRPRETMQPAQSTAAQVTVDLSTLESGVAAIVEQQVEMNNNLDWIGNNVYIGVNNLAYIANRLDDIFDNMVRNGDISLDLVPADRLQELRSDVRDSIHDSLTTFTTAQIPNDAASGFSFYNDLFSRFTSGDLAFFGWLGIFSLVTLVLGWFLFKGRG